MESNQQTEDKFDRALDFSAPTNIIPELYGDVQMPKQRELEVDSFDVKSGILSLEQGFLDGVTLSTANILENNLYTDAEKAYILQSKEEHPFIYGLGQIGGFGLLAAGIGGAVATYGGATPLEAAAGAGITGAVGTSMLNIIRAGAGAGAGSLAENFGAQALIASLDQSASNLILDPKTSDGQYLSAQINHYAQEAMTDTLFGAAIGGGFMGAKLGLKKIGEEYKLYLDKKGLEELPNLNKENKLYNPEKIQKFFGKNATSQALEDATLNIDKVDNTASVLPSFEDSANKMDSFLNFIYKSKSELESAGVTDHAILSKTLAERIEKDPALSEASLHYDFLNYLSKGSKAAKEVTDSIGKGETSYTDAFETYKNMSEMVDLAKENAQKYSTAAHKINVKKDFTDAFRQGLHNLGQNLDKKMYDLREKLSESFEKSKQDFFTNPVRNLLTSGKIINNTFENNDGLYKSIKSQIKRIEIDIERGGSPNAINKRVLALVKRHVEDAIKTGAKTSEQAFDKINDFNKFLSNIKYLAINEDTGLAIRLSRNDEKFINNLKSQIKNFQKENFYLGEDLVEKSDILNRATAIYRNTMGFYNKKASLKLTQTLQKVDGEFTPESLKATRDLLDKFAVKLTAAGKKGGVINSASKKADILESLRDLETLHSQVRYKYPELTPLIDSMKNDIQKIHDNFNAVVYYNEERISKIFGNTGEQVLKSLLPEGEMSIQSHVSRAMLDIMEGNFYYAKMNAARIAGGIGFKFFSDLFGKNSIEKVISKQVDFSKKLAKESNNMKNNVVKNAIQSVSEKPTKIIDFGKTYKIGAIPNLMIASQKDGQEKINREYQKHDIFYKGTAQDLSAYQRFLINQTVILKRLFPAFADEVVEQNNRKLGYLRQQLPKNYNVLNPSEIALSDKINYLDAYDAAFNPMKIVEMIGNGTVTKPQMVHFKNTNPFIYNEIKSEALSRIKPTTPKEISNRLYNLFDVISSTNLNKDLIEAGNIYNTIISQQSEQNSNLIPKSHKKSQKPIKFSYGIGQLTPKTQD